MNIRLLETFKAVCDTGSITAAGNKLHITQPAITIAIKKLEQKTGLVLFDRLSGRLHLTGAGKTYLEKTTRLLELCETMEKSTADMDETSPIRIASCITIACFHLPRILAEFGKQHPGKVQTTVASASAVLGMAERNDVDLAFYEGTIPHQPFAAEAFSSYDLVPVCPRGHPFSKKETVSLQAFLQEPLLLREPGSAIRDVLDSHLRLHQLAAEPAMTSVNSQAIVQAVKGGLGVAVLPEDVVAEEIRKRGVKRFEVRGMRLRNTNTIVHHRDKYLTGGMRTLIDCARKVGESVIPSR